MKFVFVTICALVFAASAAPTEELSEQCALCNNYVAFLTTTRQTNNIPSEFGLFETTGNFEKLCASCNLEEESDEEQEADNLSNVLENEEFDLDALQDDDEQQDEDEEDELADTTNLIAITNCRTCHEIIKFTAKNSHDFSYPSIKAALSHACSSHKIKWLNDTRCRLFINARRDKIMKAIFKYHMDPTGICIKLEQC